MKLREAGFIVGGLVILIMMGTACLCDTFKFGRKKSEFNDKALAKQNTLAMSDYRSKKTESEKKVEPEKKSDPLVIAPSKERKIIIEANQPCVVRIEGDDYFYFQIKAQK